MIYWRGSRISDHSVKKRLSKPRESLVEAGSAPCQTKTLSRASRGQAAERFYFCRSVMDSICSTAFCILRISAMHAW